MSVIKDTMDDWNVNVSTKFEDLPPRQRLMYTIMQHPKRVELLKAIQKNTFTFIANMKTTKPTKKLKSSTKTCSSKAKIAKKKPQKRKLKVDECSDDE